MSEWGGGLEDAAIDQNRKNNLAPIHGMKAADPPSRLSHPGKIENSWEVITLGIPVAVQHS